MLQAHMVAPPFPPSGKTPTLGPTRPIAALHAGKRRNMSGWGRFYVAAGGGFSHFGSTPHPVTVANKGL